MSVLNTAERVQKHRNHLRAQGLRPIQIWVPDARGADFAAECRQQSLRLLGDTQEQEILQWIDGVSDTDDWQ